MSGRDAQRGFVFQSIIAVIECIERDDWDEVELEPDTDLDKVDVQLYYDGKIISAIMVKSSINQFEKYEVNNWLENLKKDAPYAKEILLCLVGDTFTPACDKYISQNSDKIRKISYSNLEAIYKRKLADYVKKVCPNEDVQPKDLELIDATLFSEIHRNSTTQGRITRDEFEKAISRVFEVQLFDKLMSVFLNDRKSNPSIRMMEPDPKLFPKGLPVIKSGNRYAVVDKEPPKAIKDMILDSWERNGKRHILLVGEGGIGKTVAILTLPIEEWLRQHRISVIYVPLQSLDAYEGRLNSYLREKFGADYDRVIELSNRNLEGRPNLLMLLDGFNDISDKYKKIVERFIREWMGRAGVQIIMTSRLGFALENMFLKYQLQTLPKEMVESFLLSSGIKKENHPKENDRIWDVINVPLMLILYTQIDKVKEIADISSVSSLLDWKEPDNATHIIWNYLQTELYRCIDKADTSYSSMQYVMAILVVAPYVCCQMSHRTKLYIKQEELNAFINKALYFYNSREKLLSSQFLNLQEKYNYYLDKSLFQEKMVSSYSRILVNNIVLFRKQEKRDENASIEYAYSLVHKEFRDSLAAFFISSCMLRITDSRDMTLIFDYADDNVKNCIAEFLTNNELSKAWDKHRMEAHEDGSSTLSLMEIIGRQRNYDYRELNFSNIDFTKTNIHRLLSKRLDICPLPGNANKLVHTKVSLKSLLPNGNTNQVNSIAYSPDGRYLAGGVNDGTVRVWDLESGIGCVLKGHTDRVNSVAFSPDCRCLASGADDRTIRIWELEGGQSRVLVGHTDRINSVAFSPDGRYLASGGDDSTERVWNLESGESRVQKGDAYWINSVAYSPDGRYLASGASDNMVRIWDLKSGESHVLPGHTDWVRSVSYSPDGRYLASGADDKTVRIWNLESGESLVKKGDVYWISSVAYSSNGRYLASGGDDSEVRIWNLESGESHVLQSHVNWVRSLVYSPDGRFLAGAINDSTIRIWDLEKYKEVKKYVIISNLNLNGANFELSDISEKDRETLKMAGAIV